MSHGGLWNKVSTMSLTLAKGVMVWPFRKRAPGSSKRKDWGFLRLVSHFFMNADFWSRGVRPAHPRLSTAPLRWSKHPPASGTRFPAPSIPARTLAQLLSPSRLKTRSASRELTCLRSPWPQPDRLPAKTAPLGSLPRGGRIRDAQRGSAGN